MPGYQRHDGEGKAGRGGTMLAAAGTAVIGKGCDNRAWPLSTLGRIGYREKMQ